VLPAAQRVRARGLATAARDIYAADRKRGPALAAVEAWLARHR